VGVYQHSLAIREKVLGPDHLDVAKSLDHLADIYLDQQNFRGAEPLLKRRLAILEKVLGPNAPEVEDVHKQLLSIAVGRLDSAFERLEAIKERLDKGDSRSNSDK
jgi:Tetratricopeptide repeat